ncbi:MAG: NAD(P)/FAD-dependent oxidoreductase, partial [Anaerolineales bacterium]
MRNKQKVDLLIIGSGPAGLSTALHLVKHDKSWADRIVIVEKDSHPRPKLCGGGITRLGLDLLKDLGIAYPLPIPMVEVDDVRLVYSKRTIHVRGKPQFVVVYRADFDDYLAKLVQQSGVVIHENEEGKSLQSNEKYVTVETNKCTYHARAVVGADGSNGITRRFVNGPGQPNRVARLLEVITSAPENSAHFIDRFAHFDFTPVDEQLQGY